MPLLEVDDLSIRYRSDGNQVHAVEDVNLTVDHGQTYGLVGESGCGKTTLGKSILRLLDSNGYVESGDIWIDQVIPQWQDENGEVLREVIQDDQYPVREDGMMNLTELDDQQMRRVRWRTVSLIPQSAMNALNPVFKVGDQIVEAIRLHQPSTTEAEARETTQELLERVGVDSDRSDDYAHELSGGMRQRAVIAMAMACNPELVIADEPTTALDVIIQDRVLDALNALQEEFDVSMLIISHDISVIAETCDEISVMYSGRMMESGTADDIFNHPANPYTLGLQNSFPTVDQQQERLLAIPGTPPPLIDPPDECQFANRCPFAVDKCRSGHPPMFDVDAAEESNVLRQADESTGHTSACYRLGMLEEMREQAVEEETWTTPQIGNR